MNSSDLLGLNFPIDIVVTRFYSSDLGRALKKLAKFNVHLVGVVLPIIFLSCKHNVKENIYAENNFKFSDSRNNEITIQYMADNTICSCSTFYSYKLSDIIINLNKVEGFRNSNKLQRPHRVTLSYKHILSQQIEPTEALSFSFECDKFITDLPLFSECKKFKLHAIKFWDYKPYQKSEIFIPANTHLDLKGVNLKDSSMLVWSGMSFFDILFLANFYSHSVVDKFYYVDRISVHFNPVNGSHRSIGYKIDNLNNLIPVEKIIQVQNEGGYCVLFIE